ncbi:hypothetical protein L2E82_06410 [Cichorium intybus]|uniref:Uncharacterized protein n=1 Tax=Cichorium intybus TaxID=13427 RepID=A0ACB9HB25_CICIN|nr:hypothetical protein L2E82_06410 [Cichorium intybus]
MERKVVGFCAVAAVLGIISAATGFAGESTRIKISQVSIQNGLCVYPTSPALALGIIAAMFTIVTRIYMSVLFGSSRCRKINPNPNPLSNLFFVLSWVASVVAVVILLTAAVLNNKQSRVNIDPSYGFITSCYVVKPGIFAAGGVLALLSAVFGIAAYVILPSATKATTSPTVALPVMGVNVDLANYPVPYPPQQYPIYPPQQYPIYPPQQYPQKL